MTSRVELHRDRAAQERALAAKATDPCARDAHLGLARLHDRAAEEGAHGLSALQDPIISIPLGARA